MQDLHPKSLAILSKSLFLPQAQAMDAWANLFNQLTNPLCNDDDLASALEYAVDARSDHIERNSRSPKVSEGNGASGRRGRSRQEPFLPKNRVFKQKSFLPSLGPDRKATWDI